MYKSKKVFIKDDDIPMEEIIVRASERVSRKNKFPIAGKLKGKGNVFAIGLYQPLNSAHEATPFLLD